MKMKRTLGLLALLATTGIANATTFTEMQNVKFSYTFTVTPTLSNSMVLGISGDTDKFSWLAFSLADAAGTSLISGLATPTPNHLQWSASFSDKSDDSISLTKSVPYTLTVSGITTNDIAGGLATIRLQVMPAKVLPGINTVTPVPEPESYAMLLAGLGVMATIARRRNRGATA